MRQHLLLAAVLLLSSSAQADRSSSWWRDSSSASLSNSHARTSGPPGTGRVASYQRAAQDGFEPVQQVGDEALQSRISQTTFSRTPASTQVIFVQGDFSTGTPRKVSSTEKLI